MITRKTRLTSALLAVLMVVTMLAAYVLPVTAEESSPYPYVRDMETLGRDYADDWGIGAAEDWIAAIALNRNGETFNGKTLHFTADIDFDVDGSGETEEEEYIDPLGTEDFAFKGNIHGHGYVIKNLFLDHDLATEGKYVGLIGYANKSGMVIRDLGIASGTINIHGTPPQKENYSGAFMAYGSAVVFANCWNAATINAKMTYVVDKTELDMAPFGRGSGYTIVNCFNRGDMISEGAVTNRTDAFLDWTTTATQVYNCVNVGDQKGNSNHFFTFGSGTDTEAEYQQFVGNIGNIYVHNLYSDINKSGIDALMNYKDYEIEMNEYYTGELASKLNDNYVDKFDSLYGRKYFTLDENGELAMTDDPYEALYKLTVSKMIGDYAVSTETSFVKATTPFDLPSYEGYVLESHTDAIMPDYETNTFRMPPQNAELNYAANVPDWGIIEDLIEQYEGMVASGHVKAFKDAAAITELLDKMQLSYANKDNMTKEQAMARIALYVKDNANLDLTLKDDLAYPNYPLARYFDKSISKIWGIKSLEDWQAMIKIAEEDKESFSGITFHFLNDVDFQNVNVEPLGISTGFAGTIDGHGCVIKNLLVEGTVDRTYHALIARSTGGLLVRDLGIENGTVRVRGEGNVSSGAVYVGMFISNGSGSITFANCWSDVDIDVDVEKYEIDAAPFGRTTAATTLINCISNGDIYVDVGAGATARADGTFDWNYGSGKIANAAHTGSITTKSSDKAQDYVVGWAGSASTVPEGQVQNVFGSGKSGFSSKGYFNDMFPDGIITPEQVASGELAWKMNNRYDDRYDETYGKKYYTVKDGKLAFGAASEQAVRINVNSGDSTIYFYGFPGDTVALGDLFTMGNPTFAVAEAYAASIDADNVLTIKSLPNELEINVEVTFDGGLDYGKLAEAIASFDGKSDLDKYTSSLTATTLPAKLAEVQSKTYTSQAEIDKDVEILESYFYAKSIKDYAEYPSEEFYTVATLEELEYVAKHKGSLGVNQTILFTADITVPANYAATIADVNNMDGLSASIDGNGFILKGLRCTTNGWLHEYDGKSIKNLTFEDCWTTVKMNTNYSAFLMEYVRSDMVIENVIFDNCKNICNDAAGAGNRRSAIIVGNVPDGGNLNLKNVTVQNCEIVSNGKGNSAFIVGNISATGSKVNIDGLTVKDNLYSGPVYSSGCAYLFGENNGTTVVKNTIIMDNELGVDGETIQGVITGSTKQGKLTLENIIAYNNEGTTAMCGKTTSTTVTYTLVKKNIYSDATVMTVHPEENRADNSAAIFSGEAANVINATDPAYTLAMKNDLPVFAEEGLPVKVTLDLLAGADVVLYTDADGKLIGLTEDLASRFWNGYDDLANTVFTEDTVVVQSDCNHDWVYTNNQNGTHTIECKTPNGCEEKKTVDCALTYEQIDGVIHAVKCADCGYNTTENCTKETNHVYGTYGAESKHESVCTDCGHRSEAACDFTENKVAHNNVAKGYTEYTCDCGYSYKVEEAEKAHEFSQNGVIVKAPSYTEEGTSKHACALCDAVEYRPVPALRGTGINVNAPISAMRGEEITVEIELANNAGNIAGMNLQVNYDTAVLSLIEAKDNGIFELAVLPDTAVAGKVNLTYANAGNVGADKTDGKALTTLTFKVLDAAVYGNTEITAEFVKSEDPADTGAVDYDSNFVEVGEGATVIAVMEYLWGDANMDGNVNVADAQVILQWKVGKDVAIDLTAADADRDGIVAIPDALMLLQYVNQLVEWDPNGTTTKPASLI